MLLLLPRVIELTRGTSSPLNGCQLEGLRVDGDHIGGRATVRRAGDHLATLSGDVQHPATGYLSCKTQHVI